MVNSRHQGVSWQALGVGGTKGGPWGTPPPPPAAAAAVCLMARGGPPPAAAVSKYMMARGGPVIVVPPVIVPDCYHVVVLTGVTHVDLVCP